MYGVNMLSTKYVPIRNVKCPKIGPFLESMLHLFAGPLLVRAIYLGASVIHGLKLGKLSCHLFSKTCRAYLIR